MVRLNRTYYSLLKTTSKIFKIVFPRQNSSELRKFRTVCPTVHEFPKIRTFYIMFQAPAPAENPAKFQRITQIPRSSPTQSANHAKFAHFVNIFYSYFRHLHWQRTLRNSSELRKFRAVRPHSPRITRNSHILLTYSTPISGTCTGRERSGIPANYANSAQFAHTVRESREIYTIC